MNEFSGAEAFSPDEGAGSTEALSEEAKARFAAAGAAMAQARKDEKKHKKRDDQVAKVIIRFLSDERYAHLFILISRLVGRDCPSVFILAILSLIDEESLKTVQSYIEEHFDKDAGATVDESMALTTTGEMDATTNRDLVEWITRMQMVLAATPEKILLKLMIDEKNIDGSVLQLSTFVLQDYFKQMNKAAPFEKLQPLTASILQTVFQPFMKMVKKHFLETKQEEEDDDE